MGEQLKRPSGVPVNKVRALDLQSALTAEFSKQEWREAEARAWLRWKAGGGSVTRVASGVPGGVTRTRRKGGYI